MGSLPGQWNCNSSNRFGDSVCGYGVSTQSDKVEIESVGYSRIPVFETWAHNIRGYILAKSLIKVLSLQQATRYSSEENNSVLNSLALLEAEIVPKMPMLTMTGIDAGSSGK